MGSCGSLCLFPHRVSATEINKTHSISLTFNHVFLHSPVPHQLGSHRLITELGKGNQASAAKALWAECPWAKQFHSVHGTVMTGSWCLCSKFDCFILSRNIFVREYNWNHWCCLNLQWAYTHSEVNIYSFTTTQPIMWQCITLGLQRQ